MPFIQLIPHFTPNEGKADEVLAMLPAIQRLVNAETEPNCIFYGFTVSEDKKSIMCREAYVDGAALLHHILNVGEPVGKMFAISSVSMEIHGPTSDIEACQVNDVLKTAKAFHEVAGGVDASSVPSSTSVQLIPHFTVKEGQEEAALAHIARFYEKVPSESKCLFYTFTATADKKELMCREAYDGADGVLAHLANVGDVLNEFLAFVEMTNMELHGPKEELDKLKEHPVLGTAKMFELIPGAYSR